MLTKEELAGIKWYRQSGAGVPVCIGMPFLAITTRMHAKSGLYFPNIFCCFCKEDNGDIFYNYFDYHLTFKQLQIILQRVADQPEMFAELEAYFKKAGEQVEQVGKRVLETPITSKEHVVLYQDFQEQCMRFWESSLWVDLLDPFEEEIIKFIFGEVHHSIKKQDLMTLLGPSLPSNFQQEQTDLLEAYYFSGEGAAKHLSDTYYWLLNDYEKVVYLDEQYFAEELDQLRKDPTKVNVIEEGLRTFERQQVEKQRIITELNLDDETKRRLNFFTWVISFRDERKKYNQISSYVLIKTVEKLAAARALDPELLKQLLPQELEAVLGGEDEVLKQLAEREQKGSAVFSAEGSELEILEGEEMGACRSIVEKTIASSEIRGTVASMGKVIGPVKIVLNQNDFSKMNAGDVIVASMTRPEYVPIMKMAAAIVTDEGGITCHAAIVSRELNLPCITGTQVATRMLKDGDLVEVNANHGCIRLIGSV